MSQVKKNKTVSPSQARFHEERKEWTDRDIQMAQVYYLRLIQDRSERTRANTSTIVWVIILGIIISLLGAMASMAS